MDNFKSLQTPKREQMQWRFRLSVLSTAALLSLAAPTTWALSLGKASVKSSLGQPLRAEIDIAELTAEEAATLSVRIPTAEAFQAARVDYSQIVTDIKVAVAKRANGSSYITVSSGRTVTDPFLDLVVEVTWAQGRLLRDYTFLFDPPQTPTASAELSPAVRPATGGSTTSGTSASRATPQSAAEPRGSRTTRGSAPSQNAGSAITVQTDGTYTVKQGDTLGKIAGTNRPSTVSLEQMLAAYFQANPDGFIGGNINRLKSGTVLQVPTEQSAAAISTNDARKIVYAQSRDFSGYRQRLASAVRSKPAPASATSSQAASGKVESRVDVAKGTASKPDQLTLSKDLAAKAGAKPGAEAQAAQTRETKAQGERLAELNRNVADLAKLSSASAAKAASSPPVSGIKAPAVVAPVVVAAATPASVVKAPAVAAPVPVPPASVPKPVTPPPVPVPVPAPVLAPPPPAPVPPPPPVVVAAVAAVASVPAASAPLSVSSVASASASVAAPSASITAPLPVVSAPAPVVVADVPKPVAPVESSSPSLMDNMGDYALPGLGALIAALGIGGAFMWLKRRRRGARESTSMADSRITADSFFGGTGGQRVDTRDSMFQSGMYSSSQLNANDVDPLAEADVYLAYGRDIQAEEILKEAIRAQPDRHAIRVKLLEIYAKRRDARSYEVFATELYSMTQGQGPEWQKAMEMGKELESSNPLYSGSGGASQPLSSPMSGQFMPSTPSPFDAPATVPASRPMDYSPNATMPMSAAQPEQGLELDFDLDFSAPGAEAPGDMEKTMKIDLEQLRSAVGGVNEPTVKMQATPSNLQTVKLSVADLASSDNGISFDAFSTAPIELTKPTAVPELGTVINSATASTVILPVGTASSDGSLNFDLGDLSLDLGNKELGDDDVYETKFQLAEECRKLGDKESARQILREVISMAKGSIKSRAERLFSELA